MWDEGEGMRLNKIVTISLDFDGMKEYTSYYANEAKGRSGGKDDI